MTALSGGSSNYREDVHSVIVALAVPDMTKADIGVDKAAVVARPTDRPITSRPPTTRPSSTLRDRPAAKAAPPAQSTLDSANQALDAIILRNRLILNEDDLEELFNW